MGLPQEEVALKPISLAVPMLGGTESLDAGLSGSIFSSKLSYQDSLFPRIWHHLHSITIDLPIDLPIDFPIDLRLLQRPSR